MIYVNYVYTSVLKIVKVKVILKKSILDKMC